MSREFGIPQVQETEFVYCYVSTMWIRKLISSKLIGTGAGAMLAGMAFGQEAQVEEIVVEGVQRRNSYVEDESSIGKLTESLLDTPQSVTTLSSQMMQDRNVMSLDEALRNVPGITLGAGEFSWQGNNPSVRGFSSRNDMFLDGMRDTGNYARDPFNLEAVQVLLGPSSVVFGRGSTGGVINQSSKKPQSDELRSLHVNMGNAGIRRITADLNQPLNMGENSAFRVNVLAHRADAPGRDVTESRRFGIAPSLSVELGNATSLTLSYLHLDNESIPDYGFPWIEGRPPMVDRENFYGFASDFLNTRADVASAVLDHRINPAVSFNAQVRYAGYERRSRITEPQVDAFVSLDDDPDSVIVHRMIFSGESEEQMLQGQLNLQADFSTGALNHSLVAGVELSSETSNPAFGFASQTPFFDYGLPVPATRLGDPGGFFDGPTARRLQAETTSDTLAVYALDTLQFNERWSLSAGIRWDRFETDYSERRFDVNGALTGNAGFPARDIETSYRAALIYKPAAAGTVYLGWGTSFNPSAESVSFISSGRGLTTSNVSLEPEENESLELGLKWSLLDGRMAADAALFRIDKTNARVPDPLNPGFNTLAGEQRIKGFSFNLTGNISESLELMAGYTRLNDEQLNRLTGATGRIDNVAPDTFSIWMNWIASIRFDLGAGARYVDERVVGNSKWVDDYWTFDAMAEYAYSDTLRFKLNLTNLTDELYFDQLHPWHVIPGQGLTAVFAINLDY